MRDQEIFGDLIHRTRQFLEAYTDDQLLVIDDFLNRTREITAAYADALYRRHSPGPGNPVPRACNQAI
jgi:hypothetical protein